MAMGNVNLNAVTDSQSSYIRTVEHGFLNKTTTTSSESSTDQVGSMVAANDNVTMVSGGDMSVAGTVAGGGNVTLQVGVARQQVWNCGAQEMEPHHSSQTAC